MNKEEKLIELAGLLLDGKINEEEYRKKVLEIKGKPKYGDWRDLRATDL